MNFLRKNKGVILFYTLILRSTLVLINDAKKDDLRAENKYVMTYMQK